MHSIVVDESGAGYGCSICYFVYCVCGDALCGLGRAGSGCMNPQKVQRERVRKLEDLPNIGPAMAVDLRLIGIHTPEQLRDRDAYEMYVSLCDKTGQRHDPCVIDVFLSIVHFMRGGDAKPWWAYTAERKNQLGGGFARK